MNSRMKIGFIKKFLFVLFTIVNIDISLVAQEDLRYQRASVTQIMIEHPMYPFNDEIVAAYKELTLNNRFNDHGLGVNVIKFATQEFTDQVRYIDSFISKSKIGNRAVAKWFGWKKTDGSFNVELIKSRGLYNANEFDRQIAKRSVLGSRILEDAGENLISRTYLIMHDVCFKGNYSNRNSDFDEIGKRISFEVEITSYIYSLDWDVHYMDEFYSIYYSEGCKNFINDANYSYTFRSKVKSRYSESSSKLTHKQLIKQVVARCLDINIAKLQTAYPNFRITTALQSISPLTADIGLKEGITPETRFEVLEAERDEYGVVKFIRKGIIRPVKETITDNRFSIIDEYPNYNGCNTEFEVLSGSDFYEGMLIREID